MREEAQNDSKSLFEKLWRFRQLGVFGKKGYMRLWHWKSYFDMRKSLARKGGTKSQNRKGREGM